MLRLDETNRSASRRPPGEWYIAENQTILSTTTLLHVSTCGEPSTRTARKSALETYDAVATKIRDYLSRNFLFSDQGFTYEDDASFLELGVIDSFAFVELLHWVEDEFSISAADDELVPDNFDSVRKLSSFILGKKSSDT